MKKTIFFICAVILGISASVAETPCATTSLSSTLLVSASSVSVPEGTYFNGNDFIMVKDTWVGIRIGDNPRKDIGYKAQKDPYGNYVLVLDNGECITMAPNRQAVWYNERKYSKRSMYD